MFGDVEVNGDKYEKQKGRKQKSVGPPTLHSRQINTNSTAQLKNGYQFFLLNFTKPIIFKTVYVIQKCTPVTSSQQMCFVFNNLYI